MGKDKALSHRRMFTLKEKLNHLAAIRMISLCHKNQWMLKLDIKVLIKPGYLIKPLYKMPFTIFKMNFVQKASSHHLSHITKINITRNSTDSHELLDKIQWQPQQHFCLILLKTNNTNTTRRNDRNIKFGRHPPKDLRSLSEKVLKVKKWWMDYSRLTKTTKYNQGPGLDSFCFRGYYWTNWWNLNGIFEWKGGFCFSVNFWSWWMHWGYEQKCPCV